MSEPDPSLLDKALMEVADARELDEVPLPEQQPDWTMMLTRVRQIETILLRKHPRAARDPELAATINALADEITPFMERDGT